MCKFDERGGDPRFLRKLEQIAELHSAKQHDYGADEDPFANIRASQEFGVPPWVGAVIRLNDKVTRIKSFLKKGELKNESVEDSLLDIAVYALIALILFEEDSEERIAQIMAAIEPSLVKEFGELADMPYIPTARRAFLEQRDNAFDLGHRCEGPGELNYILTRAIVGYIDRHDRKYATFNDVLGVLSAAAQELYRRVVAPYEDKKKEESGDVY